MTGFANWLLPQRWVDSFRNRDRALVSGSMSAFGINSIGMGLGYVTQALLAQKLGADGFGLYLYVMGLANTAGLLCALEFSHAAVRFVSAYTATASWDKLHGFLRRSHQIVIGATTVVSLIGLVFLLTTKKFPPEKHMALLGACVIFPLSSLLQFEAGCLLGLKKLFSSQAPFQIARASLFAIGLLIGSWYLGSEFNAGYAVIAQLIATMLSLVVTMVLLQRAIPPAVRTAAPVYETREWVRVSTHFVAISSAQLVLSAQADLLFVGTLLGPYEAGLYGAANQFSVLIALGSGAIMLIVQPMIADLYARAELGKLKRLATQVVAMTLVVSLPVFVAIVTFGRTILRLYGAEFEPAYPILVLLSISQLVSSVLGGLLGYMFTMTSHQTVATKIIGASAVLNVGLALVLTRSYGTIGTATATAISTVARSIALSIAARKLLLGQRQA